jgi:hypothetical protein
MMDDSIIEIIKDMICSTECPCLLEALQIYPYSMDGRKLIFTNKGNTFDMFN